MIPPSSAAAGLRLGGLQKDARYAVRVTALRARRVQLPGGPTLEQCVESAPSDATMMRTLEAGAELARLAAANAALRSANERIAPLEEALAHLEEARAVEVS